MRYTVRILDKTMLNECPRCRSYDTEPIVDDYLSLTGYLNGFEEHRKCNECRHEWTNVFALIEQEE